MYEESYKAIIRKAKKLQSQNQESTPSGGIMSRPKKQKATEMTDERWTDVAAQYVVFFHKLAEDNISKIKEAVKNQKKEGDS